MNIFLGWSRPRSHKMAKALYEWLPKLFKGVKPWVSSRDIEAGELWMDSLFRELETCDLGIVCLTKDILKSKSSQWMLFESGSIAISKKKVVIYCLDFSADELSEGPLSLFQTKKANKMGTCEMVETLNVVAKKFEDRETLKEQFDKEWPFLDKKLRNIPRDSSDDVIVSDVLCVVSKAFENKWSEKDVEALKKNFPGQVREVRRPATRQKLMHTLAMTKKQIAILHIIAGATQEGELMLDDDKVATAYLEESLDKHGTKLVFLATCHAITLGERLARKRSVITGYGEIDPKVKSHPHAIWAQWVEKFYDYVGGNRQMLYEAYDNAKAGCSLPVILLPKRDCRFVAPRKTRQKGILQASQG